MGMFGVCGECMGARGYARVGMGMHGVCAGMHRCLWVSVDACGCARGCAGCTVWADVAWCGRVCTGERKWAQVYASVHWCMLVCVKVHGCL